MWSVPTRPLRIMPYRLANFDLDGTLLRRLSVVSRHRQRGRGQTRFRRIAPDQVEALRGRDTRRELQARGVTLAIVSSDRRCADAQVARRADYGFVQFALPKWF
jgi:hypothetical protein